MKAKIGNTETAFAVSLYCLPPFFLVLCSGLCSRLGAGAWINFLICSVLVAVAVFITGRYLKKFDSGILPVCKNVLGNTFMWIAGLVCLFLNLAYTGQSFVLFSESISALGFGAYSYEYISLIPLIAAVVCAYAGAEGNTRTLYVAFFLVLLFAAICYFSTFKAWDSENLFPVLGNSLKSTFFNFKSVCAFAGVNGLFFLNDKISKDSVKCNCILKVFSVVFLINMSLIFVYLLSVPYPLNKLFEFSPEGLFSATMSGDLFHRFEFLLVSLCIILDICVTSFGLLICSVIISELTSANDVRPFILIFSVIIFYFKSMNVNPDVYVNSSVLMTLITFALMFLLIGVSKIKNKKYDGGIK